MIKRYISIACISIFLIAMVAIFSKNHIFEAKTDNEVVEVTLSAKENYEQALAKGADVCFWYDDDTYQAYLEEAAIAFFEKHGITVELRYVDAVDYVGSIYDATMANEAFPDAYLLSGEELEKAYLYGVAGPNAAPEAYKGIVAEHAVEASYYRDVCYGYPLSYNVGLFAYNSQFFTEKPVSLQAIIDYSDDNEPTENVEYLLEWDAYDPFLGFPFISESVTFHKTEAEVLDVIYDEATLESSLLFLEESLESFSMPIETVTEESVIRDVLNGTTLCAIIDADSLKELAVAVDYEVMEFPNLNDELPARAAALTDMIVVNDYTKNAEEASAFAKYITLEYGVHLWEMTGHYSVQLSENADEWEQIAYRAYENAVLVPDSQDAAGFWIDLKEMITQYF